MLVNTAVECGCLVLTLPFSPFCRAYAYVQGNYFNLHSCHLPCLFILILHLLHFVNIGAMIYP
jgi:hypothetical protein